MIKILKSVEKNREKIKSEALKNIQDVGLIGQLTVDFMNNAGMTALGRAASVGDLKICEALIKNNADINIEMHNRWTAVAYAVRYSHLETLKGLGLWGLRNFYCA